MLIAITIEKSTTYNYASIVELRNKIAKMAIVVLLFLSRQRDVHSNTLYYFPWFKKNLKLYYR
jgi:hypothetical protein